MGKTEDIMGIHYKSNAVSIDLSGRCSSIIYIIFKI
nr:MAG TPA: hypothetical protein [Caudoviricetes sp.]